MIDTNDYIIDNIRKAFESLTQILTSHDIKNSDLFEKSEIKTDEAKLYIVLRQLAATGKICKAEDLLFDALKMRPTPLCLKTARMFYRDINTLTDEQLDKCNFSRKEILDGMWDAEHVFMQNEDGVG